MFVPAAHTMIKAMEKKKIEKKEKKINDKLKYEELEY